MSVSAMLFLGFGLYLSICIWIFLVISDTVNRISARGPFHLPQAYLAAVDQQFASLAMGQLPDQDSIRQVCGRFGKRRHKIYFLQRFIARVDDIADKELVRQYFQQVFPCLGEMLQFKKNTPFSERSMRMMLLGEFRLDKPEILDFILGTLDDDSFEGRTNALRALSVIGETNSFNQGLIRACGSEKYFNPRQITDMLSGFEGDRLALKELMLASFYQQNAKYQYNVAVYLTDGVYEEAMDFVVAYLRQNLRHKEVVIACLRYFIACQVNPAVREIIRLLLAEESFEIRAVAVKLAPKYFYQDRAVISLLLGENFLQSRDWYVRRNSANALVGIGLSREELLAETAGGDRYAGDALTYAMFSAGLLSYEEFLQLRGIEGGESDASVA